MADELQVVKSEPLPLTVVNSEPHPDTVDSGKWKGSLFDPNMTLGQKAMSLFKGPQRVEGGPKVIGDQFQEIPGVKRAGKYLENKLVNTGNYYAGALGGLIGYGSDLLSTGMDPRAVIPGKAAGIGSVGDAVAGDLNQVRLEGGAPTTSAAKPIEPTAELPPSQPSAVSLPEPKSGTPIYNTPQFGLHPSNENLPYPLNIVPNRLRPPSTNATVFDNLLPERFKVNEQGAATPLTTAVERTQPQTVEVAHNAAEQLFPNGDSPSLETAHEVLDPPKNAALPTPGNARLKDISAFASNSGSADQVLESRPITKPIVEMVRDQGWDKMQSEIGTNIRKLGDITEGMNKDQLTAFGRTVEGIATDTDSSILSGMKDLDQRLTDYRSLMDDIFDKANVARSGKLGYIEDYITHVEKAPEDFKSALQDIFKYRQGKEAFQALFETPELSTEGTGEAAGIYDKGVGKVSESPFTKTRTDSLNNLDYNVNKVGRTYIDSMARETFLRPAVDKATALVKDLPDSKLKELSEWYIKNITRFDSAPQLNQVYKKFVRFVVDTTSRSMLGFNPHLQALHAMRLGPVYAELGAKYSAQGLGNLLKNPAAAYRETAELGMLPQELYPFRFQTAGERADSILNFKSMIDFIDRSIAYNGFKARNLDSGMNAADAAQQAITATKKATFMVDPSRATRMLNPEYSNVIGRLGAQYKQVPAKVAEWIVNTAQQYKDNPKAAARMVGLLGASGAMKYAGGPDLFHMPTSLADFSAASMNEGRKILMYAIKGDIDKAAGEAALWLTPAGKSMQRMLQ